MLVYYRLRRYHRFLAHLVGFLVAPVLTFYFVAMVFGQDLARMHAENGGKPGCGMPALAAIMATFFATGLQLVFSFVTQWTLYVRSK